MTRGIKKLNDLAWGKRFHYFDADIATPKIELRNLLLSMGQDVINGRYDN